MLSKRERENIIKFISNSGLIITILICTSASAYATYMGLSESVSSYISGTVAIASFFLMLYFSNIIANFLQGTQKKTSKVLLIIFSIFLIFSSSTMWSIVGLSKNEVYRLANYDQYKIFSNSFQSSDIIQKYKAAEQSVEIANNDIARLLKNSEGGIYTGTNKRGTLWKSSKVLYGKTNSTCHKIRTLTLAIEDAQTKITNEMSTMETDPEAFSKSNYPNHVRVINIALQKILSPGINIGISSLTKSMITTSKAISSFATGKHSSTQKALAAEASTLRNNADQITKAFDHLNFTLKPLKDSASREPTISLCFANILKMLHWWALCMTLDLVPFFFMIILVRKGVGNIHSTRINFTSQKASQN
ncbi:hypothetical protein [Maridesulfovibrio sp.]|uniref:hypothetical protein n=1 Tax=Maridesulfovibrio sp. TaxID=2795000 RepID=UPI0029CA5E6F|nr:hypothetical protein [Maridesulfovibrio sp.]